MEIIKGVSLVQGLGNGSNIYVLDNEILVDTGTGEYFHHARKEIEDSIDVKRLKLIVNTHYHFDHTGGNKKFRDWLHVPIASHQADRNFIETGKTLSESFKQVAKTVTVDTDLKDGNVIRTENFNLVVLHTPGHSAGSICLYEPDKKLKFYSNNPIPESIELTAGKITTLKIGAPLKHIVKTGRQGGTLKLDYSLLGAAGENYRLVTDASSKQPPAANFTIYRGDKSIHTGSFRYG